LLDFADLHYFSESGGQAPEDGSKASASTSCLSSL